MKYLLSFVLMCFIAIPAYADGLLGPSGLPWGAVNKASGSGACGTTDGISTCYIRPSQTTDCTGAAYLVNGIFCQDTDNDYLYLGTGSAQSRIPVLDGSGYLTDPIAPSVFDASGTTVGNVIPWPADASREATYTEGSPHWDSDNDVLTIGNGTAALTVLTSNGVTMDDAATITFDESAANPNDADVVLSGADGKLTIKSANGANNEDIGIDTDVTADTVAITSSTGVMTITATGMAIDIGTSAAAKVGTVELGHATDTTIARVSAGVASIENANIVTVGSIPYTMNGSFSDPADDDVAYSFIPADVAVTNIQCLSIAGTSAVLTISECDTVCANCVALEAITCLTTLTADDGSITDAAWNSGDCIKAEVGTVTGAVTNLVLMVKGTR